MSLITATDRLCIAVQEQNVHNLKSILGGDEHFKINIHVNDQLETPLHHACKKRQRRLEIVSLLLEHGAYPNAQNADGETPLHYACRNGGDLLIVQCLCQNGADANLLSHPNFHGATPLSFACQSGDLEIVRYLVQHGRANPSNIRDSTPRQETILHHISKMKKHQDDCFSARLSSQHLEIVQWLVEQEVAVMDVNLVDSDQNTPLHIACQRGHLALVRILVGNGQAHANEKNNEGRTPIEYAADSESVEICIWLVKHGEVRVDATQNLDVIKKACSQGWMDFVQLALEGLDVNIFGNLPVCLALKNNHNELANYLIFERGCDLNAKQGDGMTALHWASSRGLPETVKWLVRQQLVDVNAQDIDGETVLHYECADDGGTEMVKLLLEEGGADANVRDFQRNTPLHHACFLGNIRHVELLVLEGNAELEACDDEGQTPFLDACHQNNLDVARFLLSKGVNVNARNNDGNTAFHTACTNGEKETAVWLADEAGAQLDTRNNSHETPLHGACLNSHADLAQWLVEEKQVDVNARDGSGCSPLHNQSLCGNLDFCMRLVGSWGADASVADDAGETVLHKTVKCGHIRIAKWLVEEEQVGVNVQDNHGSAALHKACGLSDKNLEMAEVLLRNGANASTLDNEGWDSVSLAAKKNKPNLVRRLVEPCLL